MAYKARTHLKKLGFANLSTNLRIDFLKELETIKCCFGVYIFSMRGKVVYVGKSSKLGSRIISSFNERLVDKLYNNIYCQYVITKTKSDASLLEQYFIAKHSPSFNRADKYKDQLTVEIINIPNISNEILCNNKQKRLPRLKIDLRPSYTADMLSSLAKEVAGY